jgi:hypothetical protein
MMPSRCCAILVESSLLVRAKRTHARKMRWTLSLTGLSNSVMRGLDPRIHLLRKKPFPKT